MNNRVEGEAIFGDSRFEIALACDFTVASQSAFGQRPIAPVAASIIRIS
jgi:hypothetical protein